MVEMVTVTAPVNIAVIKYWGKRDSELILPTNSSLSVTLSQDHMQSKTSIQTADFESDRLFLNGEAVEISKRFQTVISEARKLRKQVEKDESLPKLSELKLLIVSENNFPTAAGLASSASGFAALSFALANLFKLNLDNSQISKLARIGSGSACRSLFGGFVSWEMGKNSDGSDSLAVQVADSAHWPEMEALILVASADKKHTPSTAGMQNTVDTSELLDRRLKIVPERMKRMKNAILSRNFDEFAEVTMKDSNQFHAVCLDTFPPISYLTDTSHSVIKLINAYNKATSTPDQKYRAAYTFDAGPNAVIYALKEFIPEIFAIVDHFLPANPSDSEFYYGRTLNKTSGFDELIKKISAEFQQQPLNKLTRIISTKVGDGPRVLSDKFSLINNGQLKRSGNEIAKSPIKKIK